MKYFTVMNNNGQTCGHKHISRDTADKCHSRLTASYCGNCGKSPTSNFGGKCKCWSWTTSAKWYNSKVVVQD